MIDSQEWQAILACRLVHGPALYPATPPLRGRGRTWHAAHVVELYASGMTQRAIASNIGMSQPYVSKILKPYNLDWRNYRGSYKPACATPG